MNLANTEYLVSAFLVGERPTGASTHEEYFYVPAQNRTYVRSRVYYGYGNNCGDCRWREADIEGDPTLWNHPHGTRAKLPANTKIHDNPEKVLVKVVESIGKAWVVKRGTLY